MKNKQQQKYHTVGIVAKSNWIIVKKTNQNPETEAKFMPLTHKYMTTQIPGLV